MSASRDEKTAAALQELLLSNGFTPETRFYRYTLPQFLTPADGAGRFRISANPEPSEAVADVYGQGHMILAEQVSPGLAFGESAESEWRADDRVCVEVVLKDVLDQGGLVYSVESVITDRIWYLTLPSGSVTVRKVD